MALSRTLDPRALNAAANHPDVRPWLGGDGPLDLTGVVSDPRNICIAGEHGGFVLQGLGAGEYEVHTLIAPDGRAGLLSAYRAGLRYVFTATDALRLVTKVPDCNRPAARLAKAAGFRELFRREACWPTPGGDRCGVAYLALGFDDWRAADDTLSADGHWFHERLETAKRDAGSEMPTHDDDDAHERAVGAAVQMIRAGNAEKAIALYNQWAGFAGYAPLGLLSLAPVIVDAGDAVLEVRNQDMEVLLCR